MVLLDPAVEIHTVAVFDVVAQDFPNRTRTGVMTIRRHLLRSLFRLRKSLPEKLLCRRHVPVSLSLYHVSSL
jgi:hypothetical protein